MLRLCHRYIPDYDDAQDVLSKGFTKIFDKIKSFEYRGDGSLSAWMKRIMVNESLKFIRDNKKFQNNDSIDEAHTQIGFTHDFGLEAEDIYKLIQTMPNGYREVFNLFAIEGYSHSEIAKMMGISEGTSKSQLSKARKFLQEKLNSIMMYGQ